MLPRVLSAMQRGEDGGGGGYCNPQRFFFFFFFSVIVFLSVLSEVFSAENVVKDYG